VAWTALQPPLITLTTDFGLSDTYVGVMKGVILSIAPQARLIDLTHDVAPQNLLEAGARLDAAIDYFPPGAIHLAVVDPGVGSARAACVVETERALFVAPDNGVLTQPLRRIGIERFVRLGDTARPYMLPAVSATFHGRDVFAPVAAHLANGLPLAALGEVQEPDAAGGSLLVSLPLPAPQPGRDAEGRSILQLHVLYADRFGNLITDLSPTDWETWRRAGAYGTMETQRASREDRQAVEIRAGARNWQGIARTFADVPQGEPLAYWGSAGRLEIGIRDGNAQRELGIGPGDTLLMIHTGVQI
jgi:S-adenosylmethionine hydrolase